MYESANTSRCRIPARFVFALSYIVAVGVLRTPTIERHSPFISVSPFLL
jgi:hypothetical protein